MARLLLLDGFELLCEGRPVAAADDGPAAACIPGPARHRPALRSHVAGSLWVETTEKHATASLRSALWRLRRPGHELVEATVTHLQLAGGVTVDYQEAVGRAQELLEQPGGQGRRPLLDGNADVGLTRELLPDWYEDWVVVEREQVPAASLARPGAALPVAGRGGAVLAGGADRIGRGDLRAVARQRPPTADLGAPGRGQPRRGGPSVPGVLSAAARGARPGPLPMSSSSSTGWYGPAPRAATGGRRGAEVSGRRVDILPA